MHIRFHLLICSYDVIRSTVKSDKTMNLPFDA